MQVKSVGDEKIYVKNFESVADLIKEYGGLISIHAGKKSNSVENISNALEYKMAQKTEIANIVDFYEIGSLKDKQGYIDVVFPAINKYIPLVRGSDNHDIKNYENKLDTWVKANPNFAGLKQALREPISRILVGEEPYKFSQIASNKTKYINKIKIYSTEPSDCWFEDEILFNPELVSIIGNKGSGKSALSDIIGLLGNSHNFDDFSFLNPKKFHQSGAPDKHFCEIYWHNDETNPTKTMHLKDSVKNDEIERVRYIPQSYFEKVCNLIDNQRTFKKEIEKVIFKHLKEEQRLDAEDFTELVKIKKDLIQREIDSLVVELNSTVEKFVINDIKLLSSTKNLNKSNLDEFTKQKMNIKAELLALEKFKVQKPKEATDSGNIKTISDKITLEEEKIVNYKTELNLLLQKEKNLADLKQKMTFFKLNYETFKNEIEELLVKLNIKENDILTVAFNEAPIQEKSDFINNEKTKLVEEIDKLEQLIKTLIEEKHKEEALLSGEAKKYQDYVNKKDSLEKQEKDILGDKDNPLLKKDTYYFYDYMCSEEYLNMIASQKNQDYEKIKTLSANIFSKFIEVRSVYEHLKENVDKFIKDFDLPSSDIINIDFKPQIKIKKNVFKDTLLTYIKPKGAFRGEEKEKFFDNLFNLSLNTPQNFIEMCEILLTELKELDSTGDNTILNGLKKDIEQENLYNYLFSADFLEVDYELEFNDKRLSILSPGERGLLLLTFFLLADTSNTPLILDQPEENLDNQTIYNVLGELIKNAKKKRQVIIVTHNPNLAVVCDSEQIICADFKHEREPKIKYKTGAIENFNINNDVVTILEGTMPAFKNREHKYIDIS